MCGMPSSRKTTRRSSGRGSDPRTFVCNSLAAKAQSVAEIEVKLAARGVASEEASAAVAEAVRLGYLDDAELAGQLARGLRARGYGRRRAAETLRRRRLPNAVANAALEEVYDDADEDELAASALGSRAVADDAARRRGVSFLLRRGFSPAAAWRAVHHARAP
jgi:regulatory protein